MPDDDSTWDVQWIMPDGAGGGRLPKGTFKVHGPLPGDRIRPTETRRRGRTQMVEAFEIVSKAPRKAHACPVLDACGGCDLGAFPERQSVLERMVEQSTRVAPEWVPSPRTQGHRARVKLAVEGSRVGYRKPRSHELVPIDGCPAARPEVDAAIAALRACLPIPGLTGVEIRSDGERVVFDLFGAHEVPELEHVAIDGQARRGDPTLQLQVLGHTLQASPGTFYQANLEINALLVERVVDQLSGRERVLDLCAGIGNFSVPLAARGPSVVAVELEGAATRDLAANAARNQVEIEVHTGRVERFDPSHTAFDAALLDPPRAGAPGVVDRLLLQRPRDLVYVSCHLPSAIRDLRPARDAGYRLDRVVVFDMFPDTHHVETVLFLQR